MDHHAQRADQRRRRRSAAAAARRTPCPAAGRRTASAPATSSLLSPASALAELGRALRSPAAAPRLVSTRSSRILKPCPVSAGRQLLEQRARQHEEAAHRIGQLHRQEPSAPAMPRRRTACAASALASPAASPPATWRLATARSYRAAAQRRQHHRQPRLVVLQVAVHHRDEQRRGRQRALDHRRGQAAPPDPADAAHPRVQPARCRRTSAAVPSGLLSSTKIDLPGDAGSAASSLRPAAPRSAARCSRARRRSGPRWRRAAARAARWAAGLSSWSSCRPGGPVWLALESLAFGSRAAGVVGSKRLTLPRDPSPRPPRGGRKC